MYGRSNGGISLIEYTNDLQARVIEGGGVTKKAPSAKERPASWVIMDVPRTTRIVVAWKISSLPSLDINLYKGRSKTRPPAMRDTIHVTACMCNISSIIALTIIKTADV